MKINLTYMSVIVCIMALAAIPAQGKGAAILKEETVSYTSEGITMKGFVVYDANIKGKRPAVLVVHEWWGLNDYTKMRARKLAELGYIAMAIDMFGEGKIAKDPKEAQEFTKAFYGNPQLSKSRFEAALKKIKEFSQTDANNILAIGYCFGGSVVLNAAKLGEDLKGVVSFHGGLAGVPAKKDLLKAKILVCHGGADKFISEQDINTFKHQMDSIGADYTFKVYANATHAFTNPESTNTGKKFNMPIEYNADADRDSWNDMKTFFAKVLSK
jgi:dienelactone hydrolase